MSRLRLLVWLIAVLALIAPPGMSSHAMAQASQASSVDCPDHPPPPDPCPSQDSAKHAASVCCPLMSGVVALLPPLPVIETTALFDVQLPLHARSLVGRVSTKDPPPPRV